MTDDESVLNDLEDIDLSKVDLNNLPTDPSDILRMVNPTQEKESEGNQEERVTDEKPEPESSTEQHPSEESQQVLSADGKHTIPYAVLRKERESRQALEAERSSLAKEIENLRKQIESNSTSESISEFDENDPDLKALEEEFPEISKVHRSMRVQMDRLLQKMDEKDAEINTIKAQVDRYENEKQQADVDEVNTQIDANPVLRYLRAEGDEKLWSAAVEIDQRLQQSPIWAGKSMAERFAKVVERLEEDFGPVELPAEYQSPARTAAAKPKRTPVADDDSLTINTLSDLKGGSSPESSGVNAENMTAAEIGEYFLKMDPSQLSKLDPTEILRRL